LKNDPVVVARVMLHYGGLNVCVITVGELLTWARRANAPPDRLQGVQDLLKGATVLDVTFGNIQKEATKRHEKAQKGGWRCDCLRQQR